MAFYEWRCRRPIRRLIGAVLFVLIWPARFIIQLLLNPFMKRRQARRILVIQLAGLGDMLILTPALATLQNYYPNSSIDLITLHTYVKDAFQSHPRFNTIHTLPAYSGSWIVSRLSGKSGFGLLAAVLRYYPDLLLKLAFAQYDLAINFGLAEFDQSAGNALLRWLNIPVTVGAAGAGGSLVSYCANVNPADHRVETYSRFLQPLGITVTNKEYEFPVNAPDTEAVRALVRDEKIDSSRRMAVIHPGGKLHVNSRRWPAEYFARVCGFLAHQGFEVLLTGDADDRTVCDQIQRACSTRVRSIAGRLNFSQTAALLSECDLVITNDTATLHLAEAVKVPRVVSIFGPTNPAVLAPQNERHVIFRSNLPCAPCMGGIIDGKTERCWRDIKEECLFQTTPEQVMNVLSTFYGESAPRLAFA